MVYCIDEIEQTIAKIVKKESIESIIRNAVIMPLLCTLNIMLLANHV